MKGMERMCDGFRAGIGNRATQVRELMGHNCFDNEQEFEGQHGEMRANIMLAYRHLEDARMRLGKVMQQIQGGVSKFDRKED